MTHLLTLMIVLPISLTVCVSLVGAEGMEEPVIWDLDNLDNLGGKETPVLGSPKLIDTPQGRAIEFDGEKDGLRVDALPLAGWKQFTLEVVFRPHAKGL
ncbi:MAG: hypothetical protein ACREBC_39000, partial [Pyrinomonadaceae bacterium]